MSSIYKFLKYKTKNQSLHQWGGSDIFCTDTGFKQHTGECWHDTVQQIFCFSDALKESVQTKLFTLNGDELFSLFYDDTKRDRMSFLPYSFFIPDLISQFNATLREYISLYHARFCNHNKSHLEVNGLAPGDNSCSKHEYAQFRDLSATAPIPLQRRISFITGTQCASNAINFTQLDTIERPYSSVPTYFATIGILSHLFLDDNKIIVPYMYDVHDKIFLSKDFRQVDVIAVILSSTDRDGHSGHATGFYTCNDIPYYYNDNDTDAPIRMYPWRHFLAVHANLHRKNPGLLVEIMVSMSKSIYPIFRISAPDDPSKVMYFEYTDYKTKKINIDDDTTLYKSDDLFSVHRVALLRLTHLTDPTAIPKITEMQMSVDFSNNCYDHIDTYLKTLKFSDFIYRLFVDIQKKILVSVVEKYVSMLNNVMIKFYEVYHTYDVVLNNVPELTLLNKIIEYDNLHIFEALFDPRYGELFKLFSDDYFRQITVATFNLPYKNRNLFHYLNLLASNGKLFDINTHESKTLLDMALDISDYASAEILEKIERK